MIEYFIDVARECFNIGNFNSLMAIICECFLEDMSFIFIGPVKRVHGKFANNSVLLIKLYSLILNCFRTFRIL